MLCSSVKSKWISVAQCPGTRNLIAWNSSTRQQNLSHHSFSVADRQPLCAKKNTIHRICSPIRFCDSNTYGRMPRITRGVRALPTDVPFARSSISLPKRTPASERPSFRRCFPSLFVCSSWAGEDKRVELPRLFSSWRKLPRLLFCTFLVRVPLMAFSLLPFQWWQVSLCLCLLSQFFHVWHRNFGLSFSDPNISSPSSSISGTSVVNYFVQYLIRIMPIQVWSDQIRVCASCTSFPEYRLRVLCEWIARLHSIWYQILEHLRLEKKRGIDHLLLGNTHRSCKASFREGTGHQIEPSALPDWPFSWSCNFGWPSTRRKRSSQSGISKIGESMSSSWLRRLKIVHWSSHLVFFRSNALLPKSVRETGPCPFCDCSCQFVYRPKNVWSSTASHVQAFQEDLRADLWQMLPPFAILPYWIDCRQDMVWRPYPVVQPLLFAVSQHLSAFLRITSHVIRPSDRFRMRFFTTNQLFSCSGKELRFEHLSVLVKLYFRQVFMRVECAPRTHGQEKM